MIPRFPAAVRAWRVGITCGFQPATMNVKLLYSFALAALLAALVDGRAKRRHNQSIAEEFRRGAKREFHLAERVEASSSI